MTLQILGLLPGCVERQLDEAILIVVQNQRAVTCG
jgi:hypothetical protein